jgi:hypothetical protein
MIDIDFSTGKIIPDVSGAVPATTPGAKRGGVHLTKGYSTPDADHPTTPGVADSPVKLTGEVDLKADTQAEVDQILNGSWFFGFIQVARTRNLSASWEGRRTGEGSVALFVVGFPVSQDIVLLDTDPVNQPFFDKSRHGGFARRAQPGQRRHVHVTTTMGDHPNYRDFLIMPNSVTKANNFLHQMLFQVDFTSVFVARDGNKPIQQIAHITWKLDLQGEFKWLSGKARATKIGSPVVLGNSTLGPPTDPQVKAIVDNPGPPLAKQVIIDRYRAAKGDPRMKQDSAQRSLLVQKDFFL